MVYQGKPSTGCMNCKKRKIKCDEEKPACNQCTSTKRACPGYVQYFDLVLRDQTQSIQRKAEKKRSKGKRTQNPQALVTTRVPSPNLLTVNSQSNLFSTSCSIPRALEEPPEQDAIYSFFTDFVLHKNHPDAQYELFEHLLPLYTSTHHDSALSLAASAVALVVSGGHPARRSRFQMGRVINGVAMKRIALAIQDPVQSVQDETLMAVLVLGFLDAIQNSALGFESTGAHEAGAVALIKHREKQNHRSELSMKLLFTVHSQVVDAAFQYPGANQKDSMDLTDLVSKLPQNTANRLTVISARAAEIRAISKKVLGSRTMPASADEIYRVLNIALEIDSQFHQWAHSVPEDWAWYPASGFDSPPDKPRELFVYGDRIDFYTELNMAKVWNSYRSRRMIVLFTILDCIRQLGPSYDDNLFHHARDSLKLIQELVDDFCASIPYVFGTKTFGGPGDRECFTFPYYGTRKLSAEHRRAAAALGAISLIEPLKTCLSAVGLRKGQKEWIAGQLMRVSYSYNLRQPFIDLKSSAVDVLPENESGEPAFQEFSQPPEKLSVICD